MKKAHPAYWGWLIGTLILDQVVKGASRAVVNEGNPFAVNEAVRSISPYPWPGVFELKLIYNEGVAFGMLQGYGVFMAPIAIAITIFAWYYSARHRHDPVAAHIGLGLVASGAVGNLIDRMWMGKVTDMFWFRAIDFPVFNIADAAISVGVVLLFVASFLLGAQPQAEEPRQSEHEDSGEVAETVSGGGDDPVHQDDSESGPEGSVTPS
ncbi:MAG: signal peptidase II [Fimbriimonadaceae bacterium]|nr:signal peptidase II [Fimbriimonadaceae bacterium]